jgi:hypothetical protein
VLDERRSCRILGREGHPPGRERLHREDGAGEGVAAVLAGLVRWKDEQVRRLVGERDLGHEERILPLVLGRLALESLVDDPLVPDPYVVAQVLSDRQVVEPAAEEDRRRAVGARGHDDGSRLEEPGRRRRSGRAAVAQDDPVDEGVGKDREVRPRAGGVEVGEGAAPAHGSDCVDGVRSAAEPERPAGLRECPLPGRELLVGETAHAELLLRTLQVRLELCVAPTVPPLVVVRGCAAQERARVVRRAAAEDARPQLGAVVLVRSLPGV